MIQKNLWKIFPLVALLCLGCSDSGKNGDDGGVDSDGGADADGGGGGDEADGGVQEIEVPQECRAEFPAMECSGVPFGEWTLVGLCFETYDDCPGASVIITGSLEGTLVVEADGSFSHNYDYDYERRLSVPQSCLGGRTCEGIGCFGDDHCSCIYGSGSGGMTGGGWTMVAPGQLSFDTHDGLVEFCAGEVLADFTGPGWPRMIWERASCGDGYAWVDGRCRPTTGCAADGAPCDDQLACTSDTDDRCNQGVCLGADIPCDDGVDCTVDYCLDSWGGCRNFPIPTGGPEAYLNDPECANGLDDDCDGLTDTADPDCQTEPCSTAADCTDDGNPCTVSTCIDGFCSWPDVPDLTPCPGSDPCTDSYICRRDRCVVGKSTLDADGDGFVDAACQFGTDCDDSDPAIHFGAEGPLGDGTCADGLDNDCDGVADLYDTDCWEESCSPDGWCLENPLPVAEDLFALWAPATDDVWAVGQFGAILHWDGSGWSRVASPTGEALNGICGCAQDDGWAVGLGGVLHYDGLGWSVFNVPSGEPNYEDIGCLCDQGVLQEAWAVGRSGGYSRFDGQDWTHFDHPTAPHLYGVWAAGPDEAWVVGRSGFMSRYSGGAWQDQDSGETVNLNEIWGLAADRIWVAGSGGNFATYDGAGGWSSPLSIGSGANLYDVWGLGALLWVVGDAALYDYDYAAEDWTRYELGDDAPTLRAVRGFGPQDTWAVGEGGAIVHLDDTGWTGNYLTMVDLVGVCTTGGPGSDQRVWAAGLWEDGFFMRDASGWKVIHTYMGGSRVVDIFCAGDHGVYFVGSEHFVRYGDGIFEYGEVPDIDLSDDLRALSGRVLPDGRVELLAVGDGGLVSWYDDVSWTTEYLYTGYLVLNDVWLSPDPQAPLQAVAVGDDSRIFTFDGATWTLLDEGLNDDFTAVWGDGQGGVWVVGSQGLVRSWNGTGFDPVDIGAGTEYLHDVAGTGPTDVWILGADNVWVYDGATWTAEPIDIAHPERLTVTSTAAWAVGGNGTILHRPR